jgi:hypothetical protein
MRLRDKVTLRLETIKAAYGRPWVLVLMGLLGFFWALSQSYDLLQSQFLPASWAKRVPRIFDMIEFLATFLAPSTWATLLMAVIAGTAIEYAVRVSPKFQAMASGPLQFAFEPKDPWVQRIPDARTMPASNPDPTLHLAQWVKTDSLWFRVQPKNVRPSRLVRGVRVFLTNAEALRGGAFSDIGFGTQRQVRWANDEVTPFEPRDLHHLEKQYVDVLSVDDVHNKVFIKWPALPRWLAYEKLFESPGVYRLTLIATSSDGEGASIRLNLLWSGRWDQTEMWVDDLPTAMTKVRERLWQLFHDGVDMRNAGQGKMKSPDAIAWDNQFFAWRAMVIGFASCLSTDLKNHLQTMNQIEPGNFVADIYVSVASEMLARVNSFLTRGLGS